MELAINPKRKLLVVVFTGVVLLCILLFYVVPKLFIQSVPVPLVVNTAIIPTPAPEKIVYGLPIRFKIPTIKIDAVVDPVGLTSGGAMDTSINPDEVAWFKLGTRPGEIGSAVIAGHYGILKNGKKSLFDNINKLRQGDEIIIEDDKGQVISFIVRESRDYNANADASEIFSSNDGKSHLNLITCEGIWNKILGSYPKRLVVFADKE